MIKDAANYRTSALETAGPVAFAASDVVFRDYDIRGFANSQIDSEFALRLGSALAGIWRADGHSAAYVGRDCRISSPALASALERGLLDGGLNVIDLGQITTPVLNFAVHQGDLSDCGIMVTASHNPREYNGFKIVVRDRVIAGDMLQQLKSLMAAEITFIGQPGNRSSAQIIPQYLQQIVADCELNRSFKIVVDGGNGAAGITATKLLQQLGCEVIPLYCEPDGAFPNHDPNPSDPANLQPLIAAVKSSRADLGFALDGDGDRLVVISAEGEIIWPDQLMMIFAEDILRRRPGANIVFDIKSSFCLQRLVDQQGGIPVLCKTGHAHVRRAVQESDAVLGGEFSGHIFFNDRWHGFDDGLYAATRLLEILCSESAEGRGIAQMVSRNQNTVCTPEILIPVDELEKFELMENLSLNCQFEGAEINRLDGLRVEYPAGWGLVRASNTSAYITLRFEADSDRELLRIKQLFSRQLSPFIENLEQYL